MKTIDKLTMFHMAVTDMDKAKEFYADKLGFKITKDSKDFRPGKDRWVSIVPPGGGVTINLANVFENLKPGTMKLYFSTPDVEKAYEELKAKGVKPTSEILDGWGEGKLFSVSDPDGNSLWIVQA